VYSKKIRAAQELFYKYSHLLKPQNLKSIQKIAILLSLATIILKTGSQISIRLTENQTMIFTIIPSQKLFPRILLQQVIEKASGIFDIPIQYDIANRINRVKNSANKIISIKSQT
jgi:exopolyphosphatase / guanosine-5'-triphosphate,3'-diphosphate pyrophosphatase